MICLPKRKRWSKMWKKVSRVRGGVLPNGVGVLHLEQPCRHVEHAALGIAALALHTNGIDKVGLAAA